MKGTVNGARQAAKRVSSHCGLQISWTAIQRLVQDRLRADALWPKSRHATSSGASSDICVIS
jgi:hypothetical protein